MKYYYRDGTEYTGPIIVLNDGRVVTGKTYTTESTRVFEEGDERIEVAPKPAAKKSPPARRKSKNAKVKGK